MTLHHLSCYICSPKSPAVEHVNLIGAGPSHCRLVHAGIPAEAVKCTGGNAGRRAAMAFWLCLWVRTGSTLLRVLGYNPEAT